MAGGSWSVMMYGAAWPSGDIFKPRLLSKSVPIFVPNVPKNPPSKIAVDSNGRVRTNALKATPVMVCSNA